MGIKEYVKIQSEQCANPIMKQIFQDLHYQFMYDKDETVRTYSYTPVSNVYRKPVKKDDFKLKNQPIYIISGYDKDNKLSSSFLKTGYISTISDDIVATNGDLYEMKGTYQSYKFYKFENDYYVRLEGSNTLSKIDKVNYERFKSMIDYIELS
jgi:hypothetical protein